MPNFRVFRLDSEVYSVDVRAEDEVGAEREAYRVFSNTQRVSKRSTSEIVAVAPISGDAEVENDDD
jgi:hypothetical protein